MTDITLAPPAKKGGFGKFGAAGIALEVAQHLQPILVEYVKNHFNMTDWWSEEIVYALESVVGSIGVWLTPSNFKLFVTDCILYVRDCLTTWRNAWTSPKT